MTAMALGTGDKMKALIVRISFTLICIKNFTKLFACPTKFEDLSKKF